VEELFFEAEEENHGERALQTQVKTAARLRSKIRWGSETEAQRNSKGSNEIYWGERGS